MPLLAPLPCTFQIRFSTKSFGVDAAQVAARAIENVAGTLVEADMSDIIAGRPGGAGVGVGCLVGVRLPCCACPAALALPRLLLCSPVQQAGLPCLRL